MTIPHSPPGPVNTPQDQPNHQARNQPTTHTTLRAAARDAQVTRAALAVLIELANDTNAWQRFTVTGLASALVLSHETVRRAIARLARLRYLEERNAHRKHGEREARLVVPASGGTR